MAKRLRLQIGPRGNLTGRRQRCAEEVNAPRNPVFSMLVRAHPMRGQDPNRAIRALLRKLRDTLKAAAACRGEDLKNGC